MKRVQTLPSLADLYETDETAWLEAMAALVAAGEIGALDLPHLRECLLDMAKRDKREVVQRLMTLLVHLLKWEHRPEKRSRSWRLTIEEQREGLQELLEGGTLRNHASKELEKAYRKAVRRAAVETELEESAFPATCALTLEQVLGEVGES